MEGPRIKELCQLIPQARGKYLVGNFAMLQGTQKIRGGERINDRTDLVVNLPVSHSAILNQNF